MNLLTGHSTLEDITTTLPPNDKQELPTDAAPSTTWKVAGTVCFLSDDSMA